MLNYTNNKYLNNELSTITLMRNYTSKILVAP